MDDECHGQADGCKSPKALAMLRSLLALASFLATANALSVTGVVTPTASPTLNALLGAPYNVLPRVLKLPRLRGRTSSFGRARAAAPPHAAAFAR